MEEPPGGSLAALSASRETAVAHIRRILDLEFGAELETDDLDAIAGAAGARAVETVYNVGMSLTLAGDEVRQIVFLLQGDADVLIGGKVVTTMHAPCLIGESPLQLLVDSRVAAHDGGAAPYGHGVAPRSSTTDGASSSRRTHFVADARATANVRTISPCAAYTVDAEDMLAAIRARPSAMRAFRARAQKNFVRGLFRRICDMSFAEGGLLDLLWQALRHRAYPPGSILAAEGEPESCMQLLARGEVHRLRASSGGAILEVLEVPAHFGESALLVTPKAYDSTLVAATECNVYSLERVQFNAISEHYPRFRAPLVHMAEAAARRDATRNVSTARALARFTPSVVLQRLVSSPLVREEMSRFPAAVGFVDISGFTKLSMLLHDREGQRGAETLNQIVNAYISALMGRIEASGGDTIKFAGDAILVVWGGNQQRQWAGTTFASAAPGQPAARPTKALHELLQDACRCCLELVTKYDDFPTIFSEHSLRLHAGLSAGEVCGCYTGGNQSMWEYVVAGPPIDQMSDAANEAASGELFVAREALALLEAHYSAVAVVGRAGDELDADGVAKSSALAAFEPPDALRSEPLPLPQVGAGIKLTSHSEGALRSFVLPFVERRATSGQTSNWMSEFRTMTMLFVKINGLSYTGAEKDVLQGLQSVVWTVQLVVNMFEGTVLRLIVDDKGTRFKLAFGLTSHADDPARAVRMAVKLGEHMRLATKGRVSCNIGITTGTTFLGDVGSDARCEYTTTGAHVNMAARLMSAAARADSIGPILCDEETRKRALMSDAYLQFRQGAPLTLKGIAAPVLAYAPVVREIAVVRPLDASAAVAQLVVGQETMLRDIFEHLDTPPTVAHEEGGPPRIYGRVAVVAGRQGDGKSTIAREVAARWVRSAPDRRAIEIQLNVHAERPLRAWQLVFAHLLDDPLAAELKHDVLALGGTHRDTGGGGGGGGDDTHEAADALAPLPATGGAAAGAATGAPAGGGADGGGNGVLIPQVLQRKETRRLDRKENGARLGQLSSAVGSAAGAVGARAARRSDPTAHGNGGGDDGADSARGAGGGTSAMRRARQSLASAPTRACDGAASSGASPPLPPPDPGGEAADGAPALSSLSPRAGAGASRFNAGRPEALRRMTTSGSLTRTVHENAAKLAHTLSRSTRPEARDGRSTAVESGALAWPAQQPPPPPTQQQQLQPSIFSQLMQSAAAQLERPLGRWSNEQPAAAAAAADGGAGGGGAPVGADASTPLASELAASAFKLALRLVGSMRNGAIEPHVERLGSRGAGVGAPPAAAAGAPAAPPRRARVPPAPHVGVAAPEQGDRASAAGTPRAQAKPKNLRLRKRFQAAHAHATGGKGVLTAGGGGGGAPASPSGVSSPPHGSAQPESARGRRAQFTPQSALLRAQPELASSLVLLRPLLDARSVSQKVDPNIERFAQLVALLLSELLRLLDTELLVCIDDAEQLDLLSCLVLAHPSVARLPFHALLALRKPTLQQDKLLRDMNRTGARLMCQAERARAHGAGADGGPPRMDALTVGEHGDGPGRHDRVLRVTIKPLGKAEMVSLFKRTLGVEHELPTQIEGALLVRAGGSPYVVCEMASYLLENGFVLDEADEPINLARAGAGARHLSPAVSASDLQEMPTVEHRVLLSKMDRLPPGEQRLLRTCSVLALSDASFSVADVEQLQRLVIEENLMSAQETDDGLVSSGGDYFGVYSQLMALQKRQMLRLADEFAGGAVVQGPGGGGPSEEILFVFRKPVIREVAYSTMTYTQRRQIHAVAAKWMVRRREEALLEEAAAVTADNGLLPGAITTLAEDVWGWLDFVWLARHLGNAALHWQAAKAWQDASATAMADACFEEAIVFIAAGINAFCTARERVPNGQAALAPAERPSHSLLWMLLGMALHHLGFTADAFGAFADFGFGGGGGGGGGSRRPSTVAAPDAAAAAAAAAASLSPRAKRFSIGLIGNGQLAYTHIAEGRANGPAAAGGGAAGGSARASTREADGPNGGGASSASRSRPRSARVQRRNSATPLSLKVKNYFSPPLLKTPAAFARPLHLRLLPHDEMTIDTVALLHVAAGSIGGATALTTMADAELGARALALASRVERKKRYDLAPLCAALVPHANSSGAATGKLLDKYVHVARPLLDADEGDFDLEVPLVAAWDAAGRAAVPIVRLCRLCAVHLFALAYLKEGDVQTGRLFAEAALEDAIEARSMQLCHSACLSLAFVLWEQGGLLEAGHLFSYALSVSHDLADAAGARYMQGALAATAAMLAREAGEEALWQQAAQLAAASRIPAIEAFVLLRQPAPPRADVDRALALLDDEEHCPTEQCWYNFLVTYAHTQALVALLRMGATPSTPAFVQELLRRRARALVGKLRASAEQWVVLRPRALLFEGELDALIGATGAAHSSLVSAHALAVDGELDLLKAQVARARSLCAPPSSYKRSLRLREASELYERLELCADAMACEREMAAHGGPTREPIPPRGPAQSEQYGDLDQMLRRALAHSAAPVSARPPGGGGGDKAVGADGAAPPSPSLPRHAGPRHAGKRPSALSARESSASAASEHDDSARVRSGGRSGGLSGGGSWIKDHILLIAQTHTHDVSAQRMAEVISDLGRSRRLVDENATQDISKRLRHYPQAAAHSPGDAAAAAAELSAAAAFSSSGALLRVDAPGGGTRRTSATKQAAAVAAAAAAELRDGAGGVGARDDDTRGAPQAKRAAHRLGKPAASAERGASPRSARAHKLAASPRRPHASPRARSTPRGGGGDGAGAQAGAGARGSEQDDGAPRSARRRPSVTMRPSVSPGANMRRSQRNSNGFTEARRRSGEASVGTSPPVPARTTSANQRGRASSLVDDLGSFSRAPRQPAFRVDRSTGGGGGEALDALRA
ncbi:hypothetical protein KFE25_004742 [Diacronema lutheri]|uniref:Adenylate cyclase n=1 Tax=Diacronema lutheri TaxID=2081491 RepID=A0A8J5XC56_DIALT|nr:hypothetical protein KFE25_004742 [Diacronema lutheri]